MVEGGAESVEVEAGVRLGFREHGCFSSPFLRFRPWDNAAHIRSGSSHLKTSTDTIRGVTRSS